MSSPSNNLRRIHRHTAFSSSVKNERKRLHVNFKAKKQSFVSPLKLKSAPEFQEHKLLTAVSTNNTEKVLSLLESGVSANSCDNLLRSALHLAVSRGYVDIIRLLLQHGADPNKRDIVQNTPLHLAACTVNLQAVTLLLKAGADVRCLDTQGRNPLQLAKSKLEILHRSWKEGAIEMINLKGQLQQIIDMMISLWERKETGGTWGHHRDNVDDLELMKLSLYSSSEQQVDDQMSKLLTELQTFTLN